MDRDLYKELLVNIPKDTPALGSYEDYAFYSYDKKDIKISSMQKQAPKKLGKTNFRLGSYYEPNGSTDRLDSYDPKTSHKACIDGITTTKSKKTITKAVMDK